MADITLALSSIQPALPSCPFCSLSFKRLGLHLPHCKHRNGRDYQYLLSQKTLDKRNESKKHACLTCGKLFQRLDTHLRLSRSCQPHPTLTTDQQAVSTTLDFPPESLSQPFYHAPLQATQLPSLKLPQSPDDWHESDRELARTVVPVVLAAPTVDAKHEALCQGIYHHFSSLYGCSFPRKPCRKRRHARRLKITAEKNKARRKFRHAKASSISDNATIRDLAQKFYQLVRLHSKEKGLHLKSKCRFEALKARRECNRSFWRYAAYCSDTLCREGVYLDLLTFMLKNRYMDTTVQKAFINGIPGCTEHYCKLAEVIKDALEKHWSLTVCWLDLANAYGSVPHGLIQFAPVDLSSLLCAITMLLLSSPKPSLTSTLASQPQSPLTSGRLPSCHSRLVSIREIHCQLYKPMVMVRDALAVEPEMSGRKLSRVTRTIVMEEDAEERHSTLVATDCRGEALRIAEEEAAAQWAQALERLSPSELKFAINACQDTLPHNANLALWKGHPSHCKLCGERQTLLHVLCNCPVALQLRRYNARHDEVLHTIYNFLQQHLDTSQSIIADLPESSPFTFPPHIAKNRPTTGYCSLE